ncbi:MAG: sensor histidine kinase [Devosiaceae bacterium]|nr:sensor histidine kinase [Devosiaceae bacterium]
MSVSKNEDLDNEELDIANDRHISRGAALLPVLSDEGAADNRTAEPSEQIVEARTAGSNTANRKIPLTASPIKEDTLDVDPANNKNTPKKGTLYRVRRFFQTSIFSSLTRRIIVLNLAALTTLVAGILYLNQLRDGLIDARVQSLRVQGEIISAAIAASATVDSDVISVNPERLLQLQPDSNVSPLSFFDPTLEFPINPERIAPLLRNLITPTRTRARIYDKNGFLLLDSSTIYLAGEVIRTPPAPKEPTPLPIELWERLLTWVPGDEFPPYVEYSASEGKRYPEVGAALNGAPTDIVRVDDDNRLLISVAIPVQRQRAIVGALLLSTDPGEIDAIIAAERMGVLRLSLGALIVSMILSFFLAGTIAEPMRRLSSAAERVQKSMSARDQIPDYTDRPDEIGDLSRSFRAMTSALFERIEAIEKFAADVAHELKNPLTSLRSAVETLPLVKTEKDRDKLAAIILHDVQRLDRLISDISNASRLDAELARDISEIVDLGEVTRTMVSMHEESAQKREVKLSLYIKGEEPIYANGQDSRLAQVVSNLIDNAISFSPKGGEVKVDLSSQSGEIILSVVDQGQGIKGSPEDIFRRFYTDRPDSESFGNHSGLGLSISRQIVEAHGGRILASNNKTDADAKNPGARFTVSLPIATT